MVVVIMETTVLAEDHPMWIVLHKANSTGTTSDLLSSRLSAIASFIH